MHILTITDLTFREAWRKKIFWLALVLGVGFLLLFGIGFNFILIEVTQNSRIASQSPAMANILKNEVSGVFLILGLFAINFLIIAMTALTSVDSISGEISTHTIQTIATKPIRRWEIVSGKLIGLTLMLIGYVVFMAGGLILLVFLMTGYLPPNILPGLSLMILAGLIVYSITTLGGTYLSTLAAILVGIVSSLIMPSEAMWRMASDLMQPVLVSRIEMPLINSYSKPSPAMIVYAGLYIAVLLAAALRHFSKRDL
jgi:ABC-type transport system involved in multi-copper enzyme maturation permease subunit